ncbi:voltage-dependent calcium channel subunit alpha-2/delta-2-like isoform X2 [Mya arenaria]|uniref:voltage-dependent calcium channel subunit alpha-2/delta-2-like isoform X2 n=1 Tax=Mya arenaria TaxID=6604 RepID=UPI0022DED9BF|nr:voltage-dependent calcium channel subunit alpha-2/delta-2-like isoform X2 [Mya arenaria]
MAKPGSKVYFTVCFIVFYSHCVLTDFPSRIEMEHWSDLLRRELYDLFDGATGYNTIPRAYNDESKIDRSPFQLNFQDVDPVAIVDKMAVSLSSMLENKMKALKDSVEKAERAAKGHVWSNDITKEKCLKSKEIKPDDPRLVYNERFKQMIIPNMSSVHIPVEIYDGDKEILNGLKWSAALDEVFYENYQNDPEILWQYFGSQSGFMRTLPASRWNTGEEVDLYDVRRRPWYTQGSSSPKDMLILIDTSGSVQGQALELMKVAVKSLLDTLGENDFVNIVQFSSEAKSVSSCFGDRFVQANYMNKKKLIEEVDNVQAIGMADFGAGFRFAFEQFDKLKNQTAGERGAECNRMIMLLTDGGTDEAQEVFDKYNPKKKMKYRVFTYAVGPTANPVSAIKNIACRNRGYFSQIPAMGAVTSKVQEYVDVIARPLALQSVQETIWTSIYPDMYISPGLGMMTTVTLPVYNTTPSTANQTILGVMGIDVTIDSMLKRAPLRMFGPNGYPFAVNPNGYVVFHPKLDTMTSEMKEPPNVDILELEVDTPKIRQLRRRMIDRETDTVAFDTYTLSLDKRHVDKEKDDRQRTYSFRPIDNTSFSLGVSIPKYQQHHLNISMSQDIQAFITRNPDLLNMTGAALLIADWDYYTNFTVSENLTGTVLDLLTALEDSQTEWDRELINHLLFDLNMTTYIRDFWSVTNLDFVGAFLSTMGGLTAVYPKSDELLELFMKERDTWKANYFKRAIDTDSLMFSAPYILVPKKDGNDSVGNVMISKSVSINNSDLNSKLQGQKLNYKAAVYGVVFSHQTVLEGLKKRVQVCVQSDVTACHLLDDGAFLVATNQHNFNTSVGMFFGKVDPEVMSMLYNESFFSRLDQYEFGTSCKLPNDSTTSTGTLAFRIPSLNLLYEFLTFNWWSSVVTWTWSNFNVYSLLNPSPAAVVEASSDDDEEPCSKKQAQYYYSDDTWMSGRTWECDVRGLNCSREYIVHRVLDTNLLLVVTEVMKDDCKVCRTQVEPDLVIQELDKITTMEANEEFCSLKPRYRKRITDCYDHDPREDATKCGGSLTHPVSYILTFVVVIVTSIIVNR